MRPSIVSSILAVLGLGNQALAYGDLGHRTVAYLAYRYIQPHTAKYLDEILVNDRGYDFSDAALWADRVKDKRPWTEPWHYIDARDSPPEFCQVSYPDDCGETLGEGCILSALTNQTELFIDLARDRSSEARLARKEALMFILHFFGDLHQPLHVEDLARGGTRIRVCFRKECDLSLHRVWDTYIPHTIVGLQVSGAKDDEERGAASRWADKLSFQNSNARIESECNNLMDISSCIIQWASETNMAICDYVLQPGVGWLETNDLGRSYYKGAAPLVEDFIGKAGRRLARWLDEMVLVSMQSEDGAQIPLEL